MVRGVDPTDGDGRKPGEPSEARELDGPDGVAGVGLGPGGKHGADPDVVGADSVRQLVVGPDGRADDEPRGHDGTEGGGGDVVDADVHAGRTGRQRNVGPVVDDYWHRDRGNEGVGDLYEVTRIELLEPQLDHRRAAACRGDAAAHEPVEAIAEVVGDGNQPNRL